MERKLTAILSADVKGYSRLMGEDEEATIYTLTAYREVMATLIQQHRGRVVDSPGDNLLAEFASVVDAVRCAVEIQHELKTRNTDFPDHPFVRMAHATTASTLNLCMKVKISRLYITCCTNSFGIDAVLPAGFPLSRE